MNTQDPLLRAKYALKGATKPIRLFLGFHATTKPEGGRQLAAQLERKDLLTSLPWTVLTIEPDTSPEVLAEQLTRCWASLHVEYAKGTAKARLSSTPRASHAWRGFNNRSARK